MQGLAHVELKGRKRSRHVAGIGDLLSVEPNVSAEIDAQQMQPLRCSLVVRRQRELRAEPPGAAKGAALGQVLVPEKCFRPIFHARKRSQDGALSGIWVSLIGN